MLGGVGLGVDMLRRHGSTRRWASRLANGGGEYRSLIGLKAGPSPLLRRTAAEDDKKHARVCHCPQSLAIANSWHIQLSTRSVVLHVLQKRGAPRSKSASARCRHWTYHDLYGGDGGIDVQ